MSDLTGVTHSPTRRLRNWRSRWSPQLVRRAGWFWLIAFVLAGITAGAVHRLTQRALALEAAHGETRTVAVTTEGIARGAPLVSHIEWRDTPVAFLPQDPVGALAAEARSTRNISPGVILTTTDVSSGPLLGPQQAAITVPVGPATPILVEGQPVLVVVHPDPFAGLSGDQVAGVVHRVDDERLSIAVARREIGPVAAALRGAGVTIAVL